MDWNSSVLWGLIGLIGGFSTSYFFYKLSAKTKKMIYSIKSDILVTNNISKIDGLSISFHNNPITNLSSTTVTLKSIGKDIVEMKDFAKASPLYIQTNGEFLLTNNIESTITNNSNPLNQVNPVIITPSKIAIEYDYFSRNDTVIFTFFHTGILNVTGEIKNGTLISDEKNTKKTIILNTFLYVALSICIMFIFLVDLIDNGINHYFTNTINCGFNLLVGILLVEYGKKVFRKNLGNHININNSSIDQLDIREVINNDSNSQT